MSAVVKVQEVAKWLTENTNFVDAADAASIARRLREELGDDDDLLVPYECTVVYRVTARTPQEAQVIWDRFGPPVARGAGSDEIRMQHRSNFVEVER